MCFSCWPPSLFVRMWLWGPAWCSFMFVPPVYPSSHMLRGKEGCQICVSSLGFGSGLYVEAGFLGGGNIWGYAGRDLAVVPCWRSLYLCMGFFLWRRSCVSSPPAGGGVGSSWPLLVYCSAFSWGTCGFPLRVMQLAPFWGSTPS